MKTLVQFFRKFNSGYNNLFDGLINPGIFGYRHGNQNTGRANQHSPAYMCCLALQIQDKESKGRKGLTVKEVFAAFQDAGLNISENDVQQSFTRFKKRGHVGTRTLTETFYSDRGGKRTSTYTEYYHTSQFKNDAKMIIKQDAENKRARMKQLQEEIAFSKAYLRKIG